MSRRCTHEYCFADTTCALGHLSHIDCEYWKEQSASNDGTEPATRVELPTSDVPWNGYSLGMSDLAILNGRGQPLIIGLVGPENSGKTSLLAFVYLWFLGHGKIGDWSFAGSWTLGGWESVVQHCRWTGEPPPSFPPHTSSTGRHPGMLHVTLRHSVSGMMRDVMFTDAPGEWFTRWSRAPHEATAVGARWVIDRSSVLLLLVDSAALADSEKLPQTRRATRDIIERVGAERARYPLIVVWTKDDIAVQDLTRDGLNRACSEFLPGADHWRTTVNMPGTIEQCIIRAIRVAQDAKLLVDVVEPCQSSDPFLAFRGIHVNS